MLRGKILNTTSVKNLDDQENSGSEHDSDVNYGNKKITKVNDEQYSNFITSNSLKVKRIENRPSLTEQDKKKANTEQPHKRRRSSIKKLNIHQSQQQKKESKELKYNTYTQQYDSLQSSKKDKSEIIHNNTIEPSSKHINSDKDQPSISNTQNSEGSAIFNLFEKSFEQYFESRSKDVQKKFKKDDFISEFENEFITESENSKETLVELSGDSENQSEEKAFSNAISNLNDSYKPNDKIQEQLKNIGKYKLKRQIKYIPKKKELSTVHIKSIHFDEQHAVKMIVAELDRQIVLNDSFKQFYITEDSLFTVFWNIQLTVILGFQIIVFPYENFSETWLDSNLTQIWINIVCEWMFILDIVVNFFTSYRDKYGHVVKNPIKIAESQLSSWFFVDVISSVPSTNLMYFQVMQGENYNVQLKMLKLPKQLRVFRGVMNVFGSRLSSTINLDRQISFTNNEMNRFMNSFKQGLYFLLISNILVCYLITQTKPCLDEGCNNWFYFLMQGEYSKALGHPRNRYHKVAVQLAQSQPDAEAMIKFQNQVLGERRLLYINGWQFIVQTVTTVGQGDVGTDDTQERIFRSICMIIGVILFTLVSSSVLETTISDSLNIYKCNKHEVMIEKISKKQEMQGDSKRQLQLLGDALQTENLEGEIKFAQLLPKHMCETVLKFIWKIYQHKFPVLHDESLSFFIKLMQVSNFRRCVFDEIVDEDVRKISIVYSGTIGCYVANLKDQIQNDYLHFMEIGEELGYHNFLDFKGNNSNNFEFICVQNSELVELKTTDYVNLLFDSLKNIDYIQDKVISFLVEIQLMISLQFSMQKLGYYIHYNWQQSMITIMRFSEQDMDIMEKLFNQYTQQNESYNFRQIGQLAGKWQQSILSSEIYKQILAKVTNIANQLIEPSYDKLKALFDRKVNKKEKLRNPSVKQNIKVSKYRKPSCESMENVNNSNSNSLKRSNTVDLVIGLNSLNLLNQKIDEDNNDDNPNDTSNHNDKLNGIVNNTNGFKNITLDNDNEQFKHRKETISEIEDDNSDDDKSIKSVKSSLAEDEVYELKENHNYKIQQAQNQLIESKENENQEHTELKLESNDQEFSFLANGSRDDQQFVNTLITNRSDNHLEVI